MATSGSAHAKIIASNTMSTQVN